MTREFGAYSHVVVMRNLRDKKNKNPAPRGRPSPPSPILSPLGRSRPKFPERCRPLTCARVPNLIQIDLGVQELLRHD